MNGWPADAVAAGGRANLVAVTERPVFAGGDQEYLRTTQYGTTAKLDARSYLHRTYGTSPVSFATFEARLVDWPASASVLECGCGSGLFWHNVELPPTMSLTLTDLSAGMVETATAVAAANGFGDVRGHVCDVQELPFEDASFDVVVANHMLYHVPDPDRVVAELARVVRPNGVVLAATNGSGHMGEITELIAEVFGNHGEALYEVFGIDSGEARLRRSFASITWHAFVNDLVVDDPARVVDYGLSFPPGEDATDDQRAEFAAAVERRFAGGRLRVRTRAGAFVARSPLPR